MKRLIVLVALFAAVAATAANRSQKLLQELTASLRSLGGYCVVFEVETYQDPVAGYYEVQGDNYYIRVGDMEAYGDAEFRYEVDSERREVVIDRVDLASRNLLNNPTRAFDFIGDEYSSVLLSESAGRAVVRLTPVRPQSAVGSIDVEVELDRLLPVAVIYEIDGDRVRIAIRSVTAREASPRTFDAADYSDFEWIDFR